MSVIFGDGVRRRRALPRNGGVWSGWATAMNSLLSDPVIRVDRDDGSRPWCSLPQVYEAMMADEVVGFPALRPHQRHAWHAFLAQLGAIALHQAGREELPEDGETWRELLRALTPDFPDDEPWSLVVADSSKPAFMQCPAPAGIADYKKDIRTPDDLDVLVVSKNHDVKASVGSSNRLDDWIFALICLQTMGGYGGAGNHGIARMNGGYSSRPCIGLAPFASGPGGHLKHDIGTMLSHRSALLQGEQGYPDYFRPDDGIALVWTEPWDGTTPIALTRGELDPYFIEICRRVRLFRLPNGRMASRSATSKAARIAAKAAHGNVGDHWTPVSSADRKALSISRVGFRYDRLAEMLLDDAKYRHSAAMKIPRSGNANWRLVARGVASGQGKTEGYHERSDIVFGNRAAGALLFGSRRDELKSLARDQLAEVADIAKALRFAVAILASGGKDASDLGKADREKAYPFSRRFDHAVDVHFFTALQERFDCRESERPEYKRRFTKMLVGRARELLKEAHGSVPCAKIHMHRARARAESGFWGILNKSSFIDLDGLFGETRGEEDHGD